MNGSVAVWDVAAQAQVALVRADEDVWIAAAFSSAGDGLVAASSDGTIAAFSVATGARLRAVETNARLTSAAFVDHGARLLAVDDKGAAASWSATTGKKGSRVPGSVARVWPHSASADGRSWVVASVGGGVAVHDAASGKLVRSFPGTDALRTAALSADGAELAIGDGGSEVVVWSTKTGAEVRRYAAEAAVAEARFDPSGDRVAWTDDDGRLRVVDRKTGADRGRAGRVGSGDLAFGSAAVAVASGAEVGLWTADRPEIAWLASATSRITALSGFDGPWVATGLERGEVILWNAQVGQPQSVHTAGREPVASVEMVPTWRFITITASGEVSLFAHRMGPFPLVQLAPLGRAIDTRAALSRDGKELLVASLTGAERWSIPSFPSFQRALVGQVWVTGDAKLVGPADRTAPELLFRSPPPSRLALGEDGAVQILDPEGQPIGTLFTFARGWAVVDREGRFDASDDGDVDGVVWVIDGVPYRLSQLRDRYYEPGLLAKLLGYGDEPLRAVPPIGSIERPPAVHTEGPSETGRLEIRLEERGSGIGAVHAALNGSDFADLLLRQCPTLLKGQPCTVDLTQLPTWLPGQPNEVRISAASGGGALRSRGIDVYVPPLGTPITDAADLWVLAVGTGDYAGEPLDLAYAAQDAVSVGAALRVAGDKGFGAERTHIRVLSTRGGAGVEGAPSRETLAAGFEWLAGSDPLDTVIVFFSGHGAAHTDGAVDDYFYLLPAASSFTDLRDPALRAVRAFSGQDLAAAMAGVPALKRLVILDTCAAGKLAGDLGGGRALSADVVRAHAASRERTGAWFLAGAAADKVSYEASRFGQGVLTYSLLEGMRGPALDDADVLLVSRWLQFAETQVPVYAEGIGGVQQPITRRGSAEDFPVGALAAPERAQITLQPVRPAVVRSTVVGKGGRQDALGCGAAIDAALRDAAAGDGARFVVWSSAPTPGTWQVSGICGGRAGELQFDGFVSRTGASAPAAELVLAARGRDPEELGARVVQAVTKALPAE